MAVLDLVRVTQQRGWKAEDPLALAIVAKLVQTGAPLTVVQMAGVRDWQTLLPPSVVILDELPDEPDPALAMIVITDRTGLRRPDVDRLAVLRPPTLTLGVASRRDISPDHLEEAFRELCRSERYSPLSLTAVAASARRRGAPALEEFAERRRLPMLYYPDSSLQHSPLPAPRRLARTCAVAAVLAAGATAPLINTRPYFGKLTLALARRQT